MAVNLEFEPRGYRRLFIMRRDLGMSAGKLAAQVSHCAEAYWLQKIREWHKAPEDGGTEVPVEGSVNKEVYDNYVVSPNDRTCTSQLTNGKKEVTLITCTNDSSNRVIVKAREQGT